MGGGKPVEVEPFQDPPHSRGADGDVVIPLQIHGDLVRAHLVALTQVDDLADDLGFSLVRAVVRS